MSPGPSGTAAILHGAGAPWPSWRRFALGAAGCMFVGMGIGRFSYTAMVPALVQAEFVSAVDAGRIGMVNLLGFLIGAILSVPLARWVGRRRAVRGMLVLCLLLLVASAAPWGAWWLAGCRGLIGIATGFMMVSSLALVGETAPADRRAEAAGYMFAGVGLGIGSSALVVPILLQQGLIVLWSALAAAAVIGGLVAAWGWRHAPEPVAAATMPQPAMTPAAAQNALAPAGLKALLLAHVLFGIGLVPHTLYWVDFLRRAIEAPAADVAFNWGLVGALAFLGPMLAALLAHLVGTWAALVLAFVAIGLGIAVPAIAAVSEPAASGGLLAARPLLVPLTVWLVASSVLFGAQPGLSSLMAARARDLGRPELMPRIMRAMILGSATGSLAGGLIVPWAYDVTGRHEPLFLMGGAAMLLAGVAAWLAAGGQAPAPAVPPEPIPAQGHASPG